MTAHVVHARVRRRVHGHRARTRVTMDGKQGALLFGEISTDVLVPMYYESWGDFTQGGEGDFEDAGCGHRARTPGVFVKIL